MLLAAPDLCVFHTQPGVVLTEMNLSVGGAEKFKDIKTDDGESQTASTAMMDKYRSSRPVQS